MANKTLSEARKKHLLTLGDTKEAKGYADWLGTRPKDELALARLDAKAEGKRKTVGYGAEGEGLLRGDLSDDGYAAYLRRAVKEARRTREAAVEEKRASEDLAALRGYAAYLNGEREESADRLVALAEGLISSPISQEEAERRIEEAGVSAAAKVALREAYRKEGTPEAEKGPNETEVRSYLRKAHLPYERAFRYCIELGFSAEDARRLAEESEANLDDLTKQLHSLFD